MRYCINPWCKQRENEDEAVACTSCGNALQIHERFRLCRLIRETLAGTEVFEAIDETGARLWPAGTAVIVKTVYTRDPKQLEMFSREIRSLKFFNHPGIPRCDIRDDFIVEIQRPELQIHCLAMSKIEGEPLNEWMASHAPIDQQQAIAWMQQLAEIINLVHSHNLFHRDIKPSNIIVKLNGQLALVDFGGVRQFDTPTYRLKASPAVTPAKSPDENDITVLLSPGYTPPEQAKGRATPESDFFALGRTIIHLLTGIHPTNLPEESNTGKIIWEKEAQNVDQAFAQLLNYVTHPNWMKRPRNSQYLLAEIEQVSLRIRGKIRRQRLFKSKLFLLSIISSSILLVYMLYGLGNLSRWLISRFYFGWAHIEESVSGFEQSKQKYQAGLSWYPDVAGYIDFGQSCQLQKDFECAFDNYNNALKLEPNNWPIFANIGSLHDDLEQYQKASEAYQQAINLSPNQAVEAINNQSRVQIILGKNEQAIRLANQGLSLLRDASENPVLRDEIKANLYKNLGWAKFNQGKNDDAFDALEQSLQLNKNLGASSCLLAQVKEKRNQRSSAIQDWLNCFQNPSTLPEVKKWQVQQIKTYLDVSAQNPVK